MRGLGCKRATRRRPTSLQVGEPTGDKRSAFIPFLWRAQLVKYIRQRHCGERAWSREDSSACIAQRRVLLLVRVSSIRAAVHSTSSCCSGAGVEPREWAPSSPAINSRRICGLLPSTSGASFTSHPPLVTHAHAHSQTRKHTSRHFATTAGQRGEPTAWRWRCRPQEWSEGGRTSDSQPAGKLRSGRRFRCGAGRCPTREWC